MKFSPIILYRISFKTNGKREFISLFPQSDIEQYGKIHTFSNAEYGWILQPHGYGVRERFELGVGGFECKYPLEVGDHSLDCIGRHIEITHVIHTQMDLIRFRVDSAYYLLCHAHNERDRLHTKLEQMGRRDFIER